MAMKNENTELSPLRRWRLSKGLSLAAVAGPIRTTPTALSNAERYRHFLSERTLAKICETFDVDPDLIRWPPEKPVRNGKAR